MKFRFPDWNNSILNLSATLADYLGCPTGKPVFPTLRRELDSVKNVVFLILDGMGMHPMKCLPETAFLRRNIQGVLTSTFPSTTTNATTTLRSALYPMEHGWFGWSLYFEDLGRAVDIFPCVDSQTGEQLPRDLVKNRLPAPSFYDAPKTDCEVTVLAPPYWDGDEGRRVLYTDFFELEEGVKSVCSRAGKQFLYVYCDKPDSVMHRYGVTSPEACECIRALNEGVERMANSLSDTLLLITADHGQIDVSGAVEIYRDEELLSHLEWVPYLEARAAAFKVKRGHGVGFRELFLRKYGEDFELFESKDLIRRGVFGPVEGKNSVLLGDYIAVGKTDKIMKLTPRGHDFKGHHTSLTAEEMEVPYVRVFCGRGS